MLPDVVNHSESLDHFILREETLKEHTQVQIWSSTEGHHHPLILRSLLIGHPHLCSLLIGHPHGWLTCTLLERWRPLPSCTWAFSNLLNFVVVVLDIGPRVLFMVESERKYIINTPFFLVWVWRSLFITPGREAILLGGGEDNQRILGNLSSGKAILYFEIGSWPSFSSMGPSGPTFVFNVETCFKYLCPSTYCQYHPSFIFYVLYVNSWTNISSRSCS